jgi:hypothetical protein
MEERQPADEIIKGLTTKAHKVRALAHANYDRTEISKTLGIGYQHVRHVLLRSWITGGSRRQVKTQREPVVNPAPRSPATASWEVLTKRASACWANRRAIRKVPTARRQGSPSSRRLCVSGR